MRRGLWGEALLRRPVIQSGGLGSAPGAAIRPISAVDLVSAGHGVARDSARISDSYRADGAEGDRVALQSPVDGEVVSGIRDLNGAAQILDIAVLASLNVLGPVAADCAPLIQAQLDGAAALEAAARSPVSRDDAAVTLWRDATRPGNCSDSTQS